MFTSSSLCRKDQFAVSYFSTSCFWAIRYHSLVCRCGLADILNTLVTTRNSHERLSRAETERERTSKALRQLSRSRIRCSGSFERRRYYLSATIVELTGLFIRRFITLTFVARSGKTTRSKTTTKIRLEFEN